MSELIVHIKERWRWSYHLQMWWRVRLRDRVTLVMCDKFRVKLPPDNDPTPDHMLKQGYRSGGVGDNGEATR